MQLLCSFRIFPWGCISGFLRRIVLDAAPRHDLRKLLPVNFGTAQKLSKAMQKSALLAGNNNNCAEVPNFNVNSKGSAVTTVHRVSANERDL